MDEVRWSPGPDGEFPYAATRDGQQWLVRINDWPENPMYTLLVDGEEVQHLDDWPAHWIHPGLEFHYGKEHGPSPFGGNVLRIERDGAVALEQRFSGEVRGRWSARAPAAFERITAHLREGGFPHFEARPIPPGTSLTTLIWGQTRVDIDYFHALELPGYREAWLLLVAVLWHSSERRIKVGRDQVDVLVTHVRASA